MQIPNEVLFFAFLLLDMFLALLVYRHFGKEGLFVYVAMAIITCNLQVQKQVELFGLSTTLGNVLYGSIFFCTDLLCEVHGKHEARRAVWFGFIALILMTLTMQISLLYVPSSFDAAHPHMAAMFGFMPRIVIGSFVAYFVSQLHDIWAFMLIRRLTGPRWLWLRSNGSTIVSQAIDTVIFTLVAFAPLPLIGAVPGFESWAVIRDIAISTFLIKMLVTVLETPFLYLGRAIGLGRQAATAAEASAPARG